MTFRSRIPLLHAAIIAAAAFIYTISLYASGYMTVSAGTALWHYALGGIGLWSLYKGIIGLTGCRIPALAASLIWAVSPATMGVNASDTPEGPIMSVCALCIYGVVQLRLHRVRPAILLTIGCMAGVTFHIAAYALTGETYDLIISHLPLPETIINLLYRQSAVRPGWSGDIWGAYISVPWLLIGWIYVACLWHIITLWHRHKGAPIASCTLWCMGITGGPYALFAVAFVLAAGMLTRQNEPARFFTPSGIRAICLGIIVAWSLMLAFSIGPVWFGDTESYYNAAAHLAAGQTDYYRTPLYPLILWSMMRLFGPAGEWAVIWLQFLSLWISAAMLFRMLTLIWSKQTGVNAAFWVTILYGVGAPTATMCLVICTEPLSTACLTACAYAMTLIWKRGFSMPRAALLVISLTAAVALRPAMMFLIVAIGIFGMAALWKGYKAAATGAGCAVIVAISAVLIYCTVIYRHTGQFTPSLVGMINRYADMAYANPELDSVHTRQAEVLADIKATGTDRGGVLLIWTGGNYMERHGEKAVAEFLTDTYTTYGSHIYTAKAKRIAAQYDMRPTMVQNNLITYLSASLLTLPMSVIVLIMVLWPCLAMIKHRRIRLLPALLYICAAGNLLAVIAGAPDATARLLSPSSPLLLFLGADLILSIKQKTALRKLKPHDAQSKASKQIEYYLSEPD